MWDMQLHIISIFGTCVEQSWHVLIILVNMESEYRRLLHVCILRTETCQEHVLQAEILNEKCECDNVFDLESRCVRIPKSLIMRTHAFHLSRHRHILGLQTLSFRVLNPLELEETSEIITFNGQWTNT